MPKIECNGRRCDSAVSYEVDGSYYCKDCYSENFGYCEDCNTDDIDRDNLRYVCDRDVCDDCLGDNYSYCNRCEEYYADDDGCCGSSLGDNVHSYGDEPSWHYFKTEKEYRPLYFGFELEAESGGNTSDDTDLIHRKYGDFIYMTEDSSLNNGVEFKTHPFSFKYFKSPQFKNDIQPMSEYLIENHWKSGFTSTCGFHIHMSRRCFTRSEEIKLVHLFLNCEDLFRTIGQRKENTYCAKNDKDKPLEGRNAINFTSLTIELRFPKGNLRYDRICKNIEMAASMHAFIKQNSFPRLYKENYISFLIENKKDYPNLIQFLIDKNIIPQVTPLEGQLTLMAA
jgi:hypothetical protein